MNQNNPYANPNLLLGLSNRQECIAQSLATFLKAGRTDYLSSKAACQLHRSSWSGWDLESNCFNPVQNHCKKALLNKKFWVPQRISLLSHRKFHPGTHRLQTRYYNHKVNLPLLPVSPDTVIYNPICTVTADLMVLVTTQMSRNILHDTPSFEPSVFITLYLSWKLN